MITSPEISKVKKKKILTDVLYFKHIQYMEIWNFGGGESQSNYLFSLLKDL